MHNLLNLPPINCIKTKFNLLKIALPDIFGLPLPNYQIFSELHSEIIGNLLYLYLKKMYIPRNIEKKINKHLSRKEYTIITGARQTGKTTILRKLFEDQKRQSEKVFFISLENLQIMSELNANVENVFKYAIRPTDPYHDSVDSERVFIFIDEIQYLNNPSNFLKYLYDKYQNSLKIVATGSSAFYIDSSFDDSLAGRKRIFYIKTLSFDEYLIFKGRDDLFKELTLIRDNKEYISVKKDEIIGIFNEFLVFGGYPAVALEKDYQEKRELLKDLRNSFLKRDIDESGIHNTDSFLKLFVLLASQTGNLVNKNELANTIGMDQKTIDHYLIVLQKCFHISLVKPFSTNKRKELTKMPKVFLNDNGLRNSLLDRFNNFTDRDDNGDLLENYIFKRLTELYDTEYIRYWRTADKKEVDFVVSSDFTSGKAYEVKMDARLKKSSGFYLFQEIYPGIDTHLITYHDRDNAIQVLKV